MELFVLSFIFVAVAAIGMGVGALLRGTELRGTCATLVDQTNFGPCIICQVRRRLGGGERTSCRRRGVSDLAAGTALRRERHS